MVPRTYKKATQELGQPTVVEEHWGGGFGVMVWGAIGVDFKSELVIIKESIASEVYISMLRDYLLPKYSAGKLFLQDNAPSHKSHDTVQWIQDNNISLLPLPAYSPDLNIIENVWGIMTSNIFKHGRQFTDLHEFECSIRELSTTKR